MNNRLITISKINLSNIKTAYITAAILCGQFFIKVILSALGTDLTKQIEISVGSFLWIIIPIAAYYLPMKNFKKFINLGIKRWDYVKGCLFTYTILCLLVSLLSTIFTISFDKFFLSQNYFEGIFNIIDFFQWNTHGAFSIFIQQFSLLLLIATVTHTFFEIQGQRLRWMLNIVLTLLLVSFFLIKPLQILMISFIHIIIFNSNISLQVVTCIILSTIIYSINIPLLFLKTI